MKLTVRMRLFIAFGFMVLVLVVFGSYSIYSLKVVNDQSTVINTQWLPGVNYANHINTLASDHRIREYRHIIATDTAEMDDMEKQMAAIVKDIDKYLSMYEKLDNGNEDDKTLNAFRTEWNSYLVMSKKVVDLSRQQKPEDAMKIMRGDSKAAFDKACNALNDLIAFNELNADKADKIGNKIYSDTVKILVTVIILVTLIATGISLVITNGIIKPINKLAVSADKIAQGDLNVEIETAGNDEIASLAKSFGKMTDNINDILNNINSAAEQVASGSKQVSDSSMALSQGATEQASSIEELTASLEEISSQTRQNADNANEANRLAESSRANAMQGNHQMKEMLKAMDEINDASSNISKIIKVIDEIAFQTNILALNAAVEAARAGQHGKGFAVVAEEVRNLAARSANAAKETTAMIEGSIKKAEGGTRIANQTADALNSIVEGITKVATLVGNIAVASNEQASGIAQVNQGIMQVSQVVQTNSATSQESAAASEELASQAELLKEQVARFKLRKSYLSASSGRRFENIDPDVLRIVEYMNDRKKTASPNEVHTEVTATPKKIVLSDKEFGKY